MMTRVGVLGDVHCEHEAVAAALELFERERVEKVLAVGDLVDGPGDAVKTLALLQGVDAVRGNHDRWFLGNAMRGLPDETPRGTLPNSQLAWLGALPATRTYETPHGRLLLCHGLGDDDMTTFKPDDFGYAIVTNEPLDDLTKRLDLRFVVSGHSHVRMVRKHEHVTFINAGTLLRGFNPCVLVLDLEALTATFHDWDGRVFSATPPVPVP
jgi:putative phosphoesterase